ncbi:hypothetical protein [Microbacterium sp. PF5]|uniref:hypothetical protein n=1 Tax=Microbacterium sp. PF5 TaxID=2305435 RepID=UPI00109BCE0B|nr:hypothetical protein [Microbacterium sp. PF5]
MNSMWSRWARRRRIAGLTFLAGAAIAIALAVLAFTIELAPVSGALAAFAAALIVHAGFEFIDAAKYERLAR